MDTKPLLGSPIHILILVVCAFSLAACGSLPRQGFTPSPTAVETLPSPTPTAASVFSTPTPAPADSLPADPVKLVELHMFTEKEGWAVGDGGQILRTTSGVENWRAVTPPDFPKSTETPLRVTAFFLDQDHAWATAAVIASKLTVFYTNDAGKTWKTADVAVDPAVGSGLTPVELFFFDPANGWLLAQDYPGMFHAYPFIYRTTTGGQVWTLIHDPLPDTQGIIDSERLGGSYDLPEGRQVMTFVTLGRGFAGTGAFYSTRDGGNNWQPVTLTASLHLPDMQNPYTYIGRPQFSSQMDGALPVRIYEYDQVYCPPCDLFKGLPAVFLLYYTHDSGFSWAPQPAPARMGAPFFLNAADGWFLGKDDLTPSSPAHLYVTRDGGISWTLLSKDPGLPLGSRIEFVSGQVGFAWNQSVGSILNVHHEFDVRAGSTPYALITRDGGLTWKPIAAQITR